MPLVQLELTPLIGCVCAAVGTYFLLQRQISAKERELTRLVKENAELVRKHAEEVDNLKAAHLKEVTTIKAEHAAAMKQLKDRHSDDVAKAIDAALEGRIPIMPEAIRAKIENERKDRESKSRG